MNTDLQKVKNAIDSFDYDEARNLLKPMLKNPNADILYLASMVALDQEQAKEFLEQAVKLDPFHKSAVESLSSFENQSPKTTANPSSKNASTPNNISTLSSSTEDNGSGTQGVIKDTFSVVFEPVILYKDLLLDLNNPERMSERVRSSGTKDIVKILLASGLISIFISTILPNSDPSASGSLFTSIPFLNEIMQLAVWSMFAYLNAKIGHWAVKRIGGVGTFRMSLVSAFFPAAVLNPIYVFIEWLVALLLDPSVYSQGLNIGFAYGITYTFALIMSNIHKTPKSKTIRTIYMTGIIAGVIIAAPIFIIVIMLG